MAEETVNNLNQGEIEKAADETQAQLPELTEIDRLNSKIVELENSVSQCKDQLLRKAAEFENFKKRIENDSANLIRYANEELIEKLLPVLDDFERTFTASKNVSTSNDVFMKGVELIFNKLKRTLEFHGIKSLEVIGQPFDPHLHDALLQMPSSDYPPHTVLKEVEKGYMLHDRVIRHAKVIVSAEPTDSDEPIKNDLSESD